MSPVKRILSMVVMAAGLAALTAATVPSPNRSVRVLPDTFSPLVECSGCEASQLNGMDGAGHIYTNGVSTASTGGCVVGGVLWVSSGWCTEVFFGGVWICSPDGNCTFIGTWTSSRYERKLWIGA